MPKKKIQVVERKLGRENAYGQIWLDKGLIEIDPRLEPFDMLETYLHEFGHNLWPEMSEKEVESKFKQMAKFLWGLGYRKVDLK